MKTSIIILTYNSEKYIKNLIESITDANKSEEFEIIVVDNDSDDKTVLEAKKFGDKIKIFETGANLGFAKGINYGAQRSTGQYLLFINPDAVWSTGEIGNLISVFEENEKIGIVGGRLVNNNGVSEKSAGKFMSFWGTVLLAFGLDEAFGIRMSPDKITRVDLVSGGFMMVKNEVFKKLDGFDENLFMYIEDMELCYRAKKLGFLTYFTPVASIEHTGQGSSNRSFAVRNIFKGLLYFQKKHGNPLSYFLIKILLTAKAGMLVLIGKLLNNKYLVDTYADVISWN